MDERMEFSFKDFSNTLFKFPYIIPMSFSPYIHIDRSQYLKLEEGYKEKGNDLKTALYELKKRAGSNYFKRLYAVQTHVLDYSYISFPAYRFILPAILAFDWLAIVDWHKFQRDHVLHQPITAYIVLKLLTGLGDDPLKINGQSLLDCCIEELLRWDGTAYIREYLLKIDKSYWPDKEKWLERSILQRKLWKGLFVEAAYIAASFHDMGYPWQYINLLNSKIEQAGCSIKPPLYDLEYDPEKILKVFGDRLFFCPLNGYRFLNWQFPSTWHDRLLSIITKALKDTHGFPGAISFLHFNDILSAFPQKRNHPMSQFCLEWAAMAIMMHDMKKIYHEDRKTMPPENLHMRLKFNSDPLSCIITLADILEDFERPFVDFIQNSARKDSTDRKKNNNSVTCEYKTPCISTSIEITTTKRGAHQIDIGYNFEDKRALIDKKRRLPEEQIEYFDPSFGYLDFTSCKVSRVKMSARLKK